MIKKIAVLTSGGDAPGMNAAIRAVTRTALANDIEVFGIRDGFYGLYNDNIQKLDSQSVAGIINIGGTFLGSARFPEFEQESTRKEAIKNLDKHGIEALVIIGGDGSFMGGLRLSEMGYPCIGVPGTIDNDISRSDFTIGFDTALNTIVEAIDRLRDTSASHKRCSVVEVMGRNAGDLALAAGIATGAEFTLIPEIEANVDDIIAKLQSDRVAGKNHFIIVVAEGLNITDELTKLIQEKTDIETRATVLGHIQRGGRPSASDRILASSMGAFAVELLMEGKSARNIGIVANELVDNDITESLNDARNISFKEYELANKYLNI